MAAARLTGGRGTLVLTHPRRRIPPRKTLSVRVIADVKRTKHTAVAHTHAKQGDILPSGALGYGEEGQ